MKVEYIRATHRFDNLKREWVYRGDGGEEKFEEWISDEVQHKTICKPADGSFHGFGVHALRDDQWMDVEWIVDETINMYKGCASDRTREFKKFIEEPNNREILKNNILEELEYLVSIGMVMKREHKI